MRVKNYADAVKIIRARQRREDMLVIRAAVVAFAIPIVAAIVANKALNKK